MKRIILASNSPRRRSLLSLTGLDFTVDAAEIDENIGISEPAKLVEELSYQKALAVAARYPDSIVIGADTIVVIDGQILGKPADEEDAARMLRRLSGRTHHVLTGVTVLETGEETAGDAGNFPDCDVAEAVSQTDVSSGSETAPATDTGGKNISPVLSRTTFHEKTAVTFYDLTDEEIWEYIATGEPMDKAGSYGIQAKGTLLVRAIDGDFNNVVGLPLGRVWRVLKEKYGYCAK